MNVSRQKAEPFVQRRDRRSCGIAFKHTCSSDPLSTPIQRGVNVTNALARREELRERAKKAFESLLLQATERELHQCSLTLSTVLDRETRASMDAYRQVLKDKLKSHYENLGTIKCEFALEARRRWRCANGLLKKEDRHLGSTLVQT